MNILTNRLNSLSNAFRDYEYRTKQSFNSVVEKLKDLRNDTEVFQKVCQVAFAILQYVNCKRPTPVLSRFAFTLSTANMHDFYAFLKHPRNWFFPIKADRIDANAVLASLEYVIASQLMPTIPNYTDIHIDSVAKKHLKAQLESMANNGDAYRNATEFLMVLQKRIQTERRVELTIAIVGDEPITIPVEFSNIDIMDTTVYLKNTPLLEKVTNWIWRGVDIGCVGLYLHAWNLLDTAKLANRIGQHQGFRWVRNQNLETFVRAAVCGAFALKFIEASRKVLDDNLPPQARSKAKWDIVTSAAEIVFQGAGYLNHIGKTHFSIECISLACIIAKSIGIYSIARRPKPDYFEVASAA